MSLTSSLFSVEVKVCEVHSASYFVVKDLRKSGFLLVVKILHSASGA